MTSPHERDKKEEVAAIQQMAQAFQDLQRGEQTASALENRLDDIESKIDTLLATFNQNESSTSDQSSLTEESKPNRVSRDKV